MRVNTGTHTTGVVLLHYTLIRIYHMHSSRIHIHMFCHIQTHRHIDTSSMKSHVNMLCDLVVTVYIRSVTFKLIGILIHLVMKTF
jgi:hypothetical protein